MLGLGLALGLRRRLIFIPLPTPQSKISIQFKVQWLYSDLEPRHDVEVVSQDELDPVSHPVDLSVANGTGNLHWVNVNGYHCRRQATQ